MKLELLSLGIALLLASDAGARQLAAADQPASADRKSKAPASAASAPTANAGPSAEEMTKAWVAYATPGEPHRVLAKYEGSWTAKVTAWMDPSKPPEVTEGTMVSKMVLGGRYLEDRYEGTAMGQPFFGIGYTGYDNYRKKYFGVWIDTSGTGMMKTTGSFDKSQKVMTSWGTMDDPALKKSIKVKAIGTWVDDDTHRFEMWSPGPDGKMHKSMEMVYTRKK